MVLRAPERQATVHIRLEELELRLAVDATAAHEPVCFAGERVEVVDVDAEGTPAEFCTGLGVPRGRAGLAHIHGSSLSKTLSRRKREARAKTVRHITTKVTNQNAW